MAPFSGSDAGADHGRGPTVGDPSAARSLHHVTVVTPEGVLLEFRAAGVGSRMLAVTIDVVIQFLLALAVALGAAAIAAIGGGTAAVIVVTVLLFTVFFGYPIAFETLFGGRTPGKRVLGLRVLTVEGAPVGVRHATIRALLALIDFWLPAPGGLVALVFALVTKRSQRLGDLAAGTIVVREPPKGNPPIMFGMTMGAEQFSLGVDASRLGPAQYALAREFLVRSADLLPEPRAVLAEQLADRLAGATGNERPLDLDPERFLQAILFAHQRQSRTASGEGLGPQPATVSTLPPPSGAPVVATGLASPRAACHDTPLDALPPPSGPPVV